MNITPERPPRFERRRGNDLPHFEVTPRDEEIVRIVGRLRFVRSDHIIKLLKAADPSTSEDGVKRRLRLLFDGDYLSRPKVQVASYRAGGGSDPMACILGNKGIDLLATKYGFRRSSADWTSKARTTKRGTIEHALGVTDCVVAPALACIRHGGVEMIYFDEIMRELAPPATRANPQPYAWPVSVRPGARWKGRGTEKIYVIPDRTFGLRNLDRPEGRQRTFFFLEYDRGSMPVVRPGLEKSSVLRKLVGYGFTHEDGLHQQFYGLPNFRVLMVVPSRQRISTIIAAHNAHTASLIPPALILLAERRGLLGKEDFFAYEWTDLAGAQHRLLK